MSIGDWGKWKIFNHSYREFDVYKYDHEGWQGPLNLDNLDLYWAKSPPFCFFCFLQQDFMAWEQKSRCWGLHTFLDVRTTARGSKVNNYNYKIGHLWKYMLIFTVDMATIQMYRYK